MPIFFFQVRDRFNDPVGDGKELADLTAARQFATVSARELICSDVRNGILDLTGSIDIFDEERIHLTTLKYAEAVLHVIPPGVA